jgi:hypothetical protein
MIIKNVACFISVTVDVQQLLQMHKFWAGAQSFECIIGLLLAVCTLDSYHSDVDIFEFHTSSLGSIRKYISLISIFFDGNIKDTGCYLEEHGD